MDRLTGYRERNSDVCSRFLYVLCGNMALYLNLQCGGNLKLETTAVFCATSWMRMMLTQKAETTEPMQCGITRWCYHAACVPPNACQLRRVQITITTSAILVYKTLRKPSQTLELGSLWFSLQYYKAICFSRTYARNIYMTLLFVSAVHEPYFDFDLYSISTLPTQNTTLITV